MNNAGSQLPTDHVSAPNLFSKILSLLHQREVKIILVGSLLCLFFVAGLALVQFATPDLPDNDGYYHIRFARLMLDKGLKPEFPWLPLTILNSREFSDHHFLFHVFLIPFSLGDLRLGAKWAAVMFAALAFTSIWWLLNRQRVAYALIWSIGLLAVSEAFLYRMSITRAQSLSLAVLVLGMYWLLSKKYLLLLPLSFFYVWLYDAFPLMLILASAYVMSIWIIDEDFNLSPLLYSGIGIVFGLLLNPYFPDNVVFFIRHLLPKLSEATAVSVGSEWYPYQTTQLLANSPLSLVFFLAGCLALGLKNTRMDSKTMMSFLVAIIFGAMLFQSRRFIEYFPAFALIFCAFAWSPILAKNLEMIDVQNGQSMISRIRGSTSWENSGIKALLWGLILLVIVVLGAKNTITDAQDSIMGSKPNSLYADAAKWLEINTPEGSRVFQTDWDDFPRLFYYNTQNTYLIGLDPTYMQLYDPELYDLWVDITQGKVDNPSEQIYPRFGARYVITDLRHKSFIRAAEDDVGLMEVYKDEDAIIYEVLN